MTAPEFARNEIRTLSVCNFLSKGWEVSILGLLAFIQQEYSLPLYMVGILSTVFIVCQIFVSLFAGKLAHAIHSRNVILLAVAASGFSWFTLFAAHQAAILYLAYGLGGVASGLFEPIANSLVAKLSSSGTRGTTIGNFAAFGDMGRIALVGATTALAGWFGVNHACAILLATNVTALVLVQIFLKKAAADRPEVHEEPAPLQDLTRNRNFCLATAAGIADSFSSASLYIFIPFLLTAKGIGLANTLYYDVVFFAGYMSGRLLLGRLADKHGSARVLIVAEMMMAVFIILLTLASGTISILALLFVLGIFTRGTSPIIRVMVANSMDEHISFHDAFSAYSFVSRGSSAVCRPIYGFLMSYAGIAWVFYIASGVALITIYPASKYKE